MPKVRVLTLMVLAIFFTGASVRLYGSLATGMALKEDVKVNVDLNVPNVSKENALSVFLDIVKVLEDDDSMRYVLRMREFCSHGPCNMT